MVRRATTSRGSTRRSSCIRGSGRRAATSPASPIRSSTARRARGASAPTSSRTHSASGSRRKQCPARRRTGQLTEPRQFNLMFKTFMGPVEDSAAVVYLRPETAQGIYVNFLNVQQSTRQKVPFGIAQIGKAFRNEITPGNFIFRTREFEQMEMQFFVEPGTDMEWFEYWKEQRMEWHQSLGLDPERLRFHQHTTERARALRARGVRHRVRLRRHARLPGDRGHPQPRRLRPRAGTRSIPARSSSTSTSRTTSATCRTSSRRRSAPTARRSRVLVNAYREEKVEGEDEGRTVLALASVARADQGRRVPAREEGRHAGVSPTKLAARAAHSASRCSTTSRARSAGAIAARTKSARRSASRSTARRCKDGTVTVRDRDTLQAGARRRRSRCAAIIRGAARAR